MSTFKKQSHTLYHCKYHIVFCPKYRNRVLHGKVEHILKSELYNLCRWKEQLEIIELNIQADHVHIILDIAPKYSIAKIMGMLKGKTTIRLFKHYPNLRKECWSGKLWSRGYCVSTVGLNEDKIKKYVRWQTKQEDLFR